MLSETIEDLNQRGWVANSSCRVGDFRLSFYISDPIKKYNNNILMVNIYPIDKYNALYFKGLRFEYSLTCIYVVY